MGISSRFCWVPKANVRSEHRQSDTAGRIEKRLQSQKGTPDRTKEDEQTSQSRGKGAARSTRVPWYERMMARHTEPAFQGQVKAKCSRDQIKAGLQGGAAQVQASKSQQQMHGSSSEVKAAAESTPPPCRKGPAPPSKGLLIKAVPGQRAHARQASFRVETSWLAVADVSFADMLQVVDMAAKQDRQQRSSCDGASAECTLVFPRLKGRVSDSGCRSQVSKKTAVARINSPRPPSNLGAHTQGDTQSRCMKKSQPAAKLSSAARFPEKRPCKTAAGRAKSDASRPAWTQRSACTFPDTHQHLLQRAALAQLPSYVERPSNQAAVRV